MNDKLNDKRNKLEADYASHCDKYDVCDNCKYNGSTDCKMDL